MNSRFAMALSITALVFSIGALALGLLPAPALRAKLAQQDTTYTLIVVGDHYRQTIDFKSAFDCGQAAAYFAGGSAGQLTANCVRR